MNKYNQGFKIHLLAAIIFGFAFFPGPGIRAQSSVMHVLKINTPVDVRDYFKYTGKDIPLISGHRGGMAKGFPENCIASFENTLRHTPAFFEIDPRLTKDSVIVLMHDATLDRTTTGTGKLSDYTWAELQKLRLKDNEGNITDYRIPTLDEAIIWSKGKTIINLDKKDVPPAITARKIREHNAEGHVMVTVHTGDQAKFYYENNNQLMFSAFVMTKESLADYEKAEIPSSHMIAYIGPHYKPENKELIDLLHSKGIMCMISAASSYDKLQDPDERKTSYQKIIRSGADIVESDLPIEAAKAITTLLPRDSKKKIFF